MRVLRTIRSAVLALLVVAAAGCDSLGDALTPHTDAVARAAGYELSVDEAASLLTESEQLEPSRPVAEALANVWIDYILVAHQIRSDSTFGNLDLGPVIEPEIEQAMVYELRESVIDVDTTVTDEELRRLYETEKPGARIRARHILFSFPPEASEGERDSVRALAEDVLERARAGEDFAGLAREFSDDSVTAVEGGDLGFFGHGEMVGPFEKVAFALDPGQISDIVRTPFGLHIIKAEEQRIAGFDDVADMFRRRVKERRVMSAESTYVESIIDTADVEIHDDGVGILQGLIRNPRSELTSRAAERAVVSYPGGELTAGELLSLARSLSQNQRQNVLGTPDEQIRGLLERLATQDALVTEAERRGMTLDSVRRDSIAAAARERILNLAGQLRIRSVDAGADETGKEAVERAVHETLAAILRGDRHLVAMGNIAHVLRREHGAQLFSHNVPRVVERARAAGSRSGDAPPAAPGRPETRPAPNAPRTLPGTPPARPDTTSPGAGTSGGDGA